MKSDVQDEINVWLIDYCDELKEENKVLSKRLDQYIDILEAIAEKICK